MNWNNWIDNIEIILATADNWEQIFFEFYVNKPLKNPKILIEKAHDLSEFSKEVKNMIYIYKQVIPFIESLYPSPNFETLHKLATNLHRSNNLPIVKTKLIYNDHFVQLFPIDPFSLYLVPTESSWINIIHGDHIPKTFSVEWDMSYFTEFEIKLDSNTNFKLDFSPLIEHKSFRLKGHMLYLFEASKEERKEVINFTITVLTDKNQKPSGDISVRFGTHRNETDIVKTQIYLRKLKIMLKNLNEFYKRINYDKNENLKDIEKYKNEFKMKVRKTNIEETSEPVN